jgi:hypothetical protein
VRQAWGGERQGPCGRGTVAWWIFSASMYEQQLRAREIREEIMFRGGPTNYAAAGRVDASACAMMAIQWPRSNCRQVSAYCKLLLDMICVSTTAIC